MSDNGFPSKASTCSKVVMVNVDDSQLLFMFSEYNMTVAENRAIDYIIYGAKTRPSVSKSASFLLFMSAFIGLFCRPNFYCMIVFFGHVC